jgi:hypothetical protein
MAIKKLKKNLFLNSNAIMTLLFLLILSSIVGFTATIKSTLVLNKKIAVEVEKTRPANIEMIIIEESGCAQCVKLELLKEAVLKQKVKLVKDEKLSFQDAKAKELIEKFKIAKLPVMLVTGEISKHPEVEAFWGKLGKITDNTFVLTQIATPYFEIATGEVRGKTSVVYLSDKSCETCYDVNLHENILTKNFGLFLDEKTSLDISSKEGKALIAKYDLIYVPTIIVTGEVPLYAQLNSIWSQVGTIEKDGAYVFREGVKNMRGVYKDLSTDKEVSPAPAEPKQ